MRYSKRNLHSSWEKISIEQSCWPSLFVFCLASEFRCVWPAAWVQNAKQYKDRTYIDSYDTVEEGRGWVKLIWVGFLTFGILLQNLTPSYETTVPQLIALISIMCKNWTLLSYIKGSSSTVPLLSVTSQMLVDAWHSLTHAKLYKLLAPLQSPMFELKWSEMYIVSLVIILRWSMHESRPLMPHYWVMSLSV